MFQTRIVQQPNRRTLYASLLIHTALIGFLSSRSFVTTIKRAEIVQVVHAADWEPLTTPVAAAAAEPLPNRHAAVAPVVVPRELPEHIAELSDIDVSSDLPESALEDRAKTLAALISGNGVGAEVGIPESSPVPDVGKETSKDELSAEPPPPPVRIGGHLQTAHIVHQVTPVYPSLARTGRIQGVVVIDAVITQSGSLKEITVRSGHPLLIEAAVNCVRQWKYQPAILNGIPVESPVHIQVQFRLQPATSGD